jgi:hypothetical protein
MMPDAIAFILVGIGAVWLWISLSFPPLFLHLYPQ